VCCPVTKMASPLGMERTRNIAQTTASLTAARIVSLDDRVAAGKALRDKISREQHGRWNEVRGRPNPIDLLHKSDAGRLKTMIPIRYGRMLRSPACGWALARAHAKASRSEKFREALGPLRGRRSADFAQWEGRGAPLLPSASSKRKECKSVKPCDSENPTPDISRRDSWL